MRNFTFSPSKLFRLNFLILFLVLISNNASAQFYTKHYIAPAPWQYFSKANEVVIATNSTSTVNITLKRSDGTLEANLTATKGQPAIYRFTAFATTLPMNPLNTVIKGAGLIIESNLPTSVNVRNIASDDYKDNENADANIKGNAALTSFGDAGIGIRFRVGYYRDGSLGSFGSFGDQRPIYSIMATVDNTSITINNKIVATLNAGQSYLFKADMGSLVESSNLSVMNTSAAIDTPGGCGDGASNQIPPESVLGTEYFLERGTGNDIAEQTTVIATKDNTNITVEGYKADGTLSSSKTVNLAQAGKFYTFVNGVPGVSFTASHILADKRVAVYSGTAQNCEVDISTIAPVSECGGSNFIETAKFRNYRGATLDYFGYILLRSATEPVTVNGKDITTIAGVGARYQIGSTGWYLINFNSKQIGGPDVLSIASSAKLTVSIVQQDGGFSMAGFFSSFAIQPEDPTLTYISGGGCTNNSATLTTPSGFSPYQWYLNGVAITGANSDNYTATKTGSYSVASTLTCGAQTQSKPVSVTLCTDLEVKKTVDNATPCVGSNVEFTVKVSNLGVNNSTGVSINDLLPTGYAFVSSTQSIGSYNSGTGVWSIGDINGGAAETLKIIAKVNASGVYTNTASLPNTTIDSNPGNNTASVSTTPNPLPTLTITNPAAVCSPSKVDLTLPAVTSGSSANLTFTYWTDATATVLYNTPTLATVGTYYIKGTTTSGCSVIKPVVVTVNTTPAAPASSAQTFCSVEAKKVNDLVVTLGTGSTKKWYNAITGGILYSGTELLATGNYFVSQTSSSGCESSRTSVSVTVNTTPAAPTSSAQTFCSVEAKTVNDLVVILDTGASKKWYSAITGGTLYSGTELLATGNYFVSQTSSSGCESSRTSVFVTVNPITAVPTIASTVATCSSDGISKVSNYDSTLTYAFTPSGPTIASTGVINGMTVGTNYTITAKSINNCTSSSSASFNNSAKLVTPAVPVITPTAATCSADGISSVSNYDGTLTYTFDPTGPTIASTGVISGMVIATDYTLTAGNTTCTSAATSAFRNNIKLVIPAVPAITLTVATCAADGISSVSNYDANLTYTFDPTGPTIASTGVISGMVIGTDYTLTAGNTTCTSAATSAFRNNVKLVTPAVPAITPTAATCAADGISTVSNYDGTLTYTFDPTGPTIASTGVISGMVIATDYTLTAGNTTCTSAATSAFRNNIKLVIPAVPAITPTAATCSADGISTVSNYDGTLTYTFDPTGPTIASTGIISGMVIGTDYTLTAGNTTCTSAATSVFRNNIKLVIPAVPAITPTEATCAADGISTVSNYDANLTYTFDPTGPTIASTGIISGMVIATDYTLTAGNTTCTSAATSVFRNNIKLVIPAVPAITPTAATCSADGISTVSNYEGTLTYTFDPIGPTIASTGVISGMVIATDYTLTAGNTTCTSAATSAFRNNVKLVTPAVPAITPTAATCSADGISTVSNYDGTLTYTFDPTGPTIASTGIISGMVIATDYTLTAGNTTCTSAATSAFRNNIKLVIPAVPAITPTVATCAADGISTVSNYDGTLTYTFDPVGPTIASTGVISGMVIATDYTLTAGNSNCTSAATSVFRNNIKLVTPAVPAITPTAATCSADGISTVSNYDGTLTYTFDPTGPTIASTGVISGMVIGTDYILTAGNTTCTSAATSVFRNNIKLVTPAVPAITPTAATCSADGISTVSNYDGTLTYTFDPTGPTIASTGVISGMVIGTDYTLTAGNTTCTSAATSVFRNNIKLVTPAVPAITPTAATCAADGISTVSNYDANLTYTFDPTGPTIASTGVISGMVIATDYTLTAGNTTCASAATSAFRNNIKLVSPVTPLLSSVTQPTCATATGSFIITNYDASYTYAITPLVGVIQNGEKITAPEGSYTLNAIAGNCTSSSSLIAVINAQPETPVQPLLSSVTQQTCTVSTGSFTISNYNSSYNYLITPSAGVTQTASMITAPAGIYTIIAEANGCESLSSNVVIDSKICANTDNTFAVQISSSTAVLVGNVTSNDTLNGLPVSSATTIVTPITNGLLSIGADGGLTLAPNTPSGTYTITYQICEKGATPDNCATTTATVVVGKGSIIALTENTVPINGSIGGTTFSLTNNDTLNGNAVIIKNSTGGVILTSISVPTGLTLNQDGTVTVKAGTPIGNYEIEYSICEYINATNNCATIKSYVPVIGAALQANNDNAGTVDSNKGQSSSTSIFHNDTLNGAVLNPADVILSTVVSNPYLILKADGTIEVKPGTPSGNYELTYQICEVLNPSSNCSQAIAKISVVNVLDPQPPITPLTRIIINNDEAVSVDGINGAIEFINVLDNDLLNGLPINTLDIIITNTPQNPYFEFNPDGTVNVKPNTPGGNYVLTYQVCEKAKPSNCNTGTLSVFVEVPAIAIIKTAVFNDENNSGFANAGETISYKFKVTNTGNVPLKNVMVSDLLPGIAFSGQAIDLDVNESDEHNFSATYKITQSDINKGSVSNQATVKGTSDKGVVVEDKSDNENNTDDRPTVLPLNGCVIKVFNAFSPNGDDKNSRFYIQGLECYPDNTVEIYNRWGVLVYDIDKYNNEDRAFKGFSEGRTTIKQSDGLPVGTYFYILKYKDSESNPKELSGYLYINK